MNRSTKAAELLRTALALLIGVAIMAIIALPIHFVLYVSLVFLMEAAATNISTAISITKIVSYIVAAVISIKLFFKWLNSSPKEEKER